MMEGIVKSLMNCFFVFQMHEFGQSSDYSSLFCGHWQDRSVDPDGHGIGFDGGQGARVPAGHCTDDAGSEGVYGAECGE